MYNLLIAFTLGTLVFAATGAWMGPWAGIVPAILVWMGAMFLLARRTNQQIEVASAALAPLMQEGKVDQAKALLERVRTDFGWWQPLLSAGIDAQLGMLDMARLKFAEAEPQLQKGRSRNWTAMTALATIHYRKGRKEKCWDEIEDAASYGSKEAIVYAVWAVLAVRSGDRPRALAALAQGLEALPDSEFLKGLQKTVANKKKVNTRKFPDAWYQFFPEDMVRQHLMRGRRDGGGPMQQAQAARHGAKAVHRTR
jgi:tetratricopeptide (TPR) repeat protein